MTKSRRHEYSNRRRRRGKHTKGKHTKDKQPIVPTNLPPLEENKIEEPNNGRLIARNSLLKHINYLMEMDRKGERLTTRRQPPEKKFLEDKMSFMRWLDKKMEEEHKPVDPSLDDYFNNNEDNYRRSPDPSPIPSPSPSPTKRPDPTTKDELLFDDLRLPDIRDKTPPISGGKSRRIFRRRKMDSRRRKRRITRKRT
jgi:hypothetical protein